MEIKKKRNQTPGDMTWRGFCEEKDIYIVGYYSVKALQGGFDDVYRCC